jgi:hypothetical protein
MLLGRSSQKRGFKFAAIAPIGSVPLSANVAQARFEAQQASQDAKIAFNPSGNFPSIPPLRQPFDPASTMIKVV